MVGKWRRDTSFVTATPSTVTSSSAAFGRWAFGIGQPRRDRRGRTDIVKGRSVRSGGNVLTALSCSASGISPSDAVLRDLLQRGSHAPFGQQRRAVAPNSTYPRPHLAHGISSRTSSSYVRV